MVHAAEHAVRGAGRQVPIPHRVTDRTFNVATLLVDRHVSEGRGDRPAVHVDGRTIRYAELLELCNRAGNALRAAGVESEHRVALLLPDGWEFLVAFIGALKIGAVPVPLNTVAPRDDLAFYLDDTRARALVTTPELARRAPLDDPRLLLKAVFLVGGSADISPLERSFETELDRASPALETFPTGVDEPCYWLYSSGTTGRPKGVVHLHGDMPACVAPFAEQVVGMSVEDVTFSVSRLFFSYGLVNSLFLPLFAGASVALVGERPTSAEFARIMAATRPTLFFSVPTSYAALCVDIENDRGHHPFGGVRLAVTAGEPLPAPLYERWTRLTGVELLDGIGSTEVGYIFLSNTPGHVRPGASGKLLGEHEARVVDESGRDLPDDEEGELWVKAESTALHYWNQRERTKETFVGPWLRTGDRYRRDADGYYWYIGRANDVFKVAGQWVSPLEVESCLLEHPGVAEVAVVGAADTNGLLKPKAYVVPREQVTVSVEELQMHVKARLKPHNYPRWVVFVDQLPKTATGKIQRFRLREQDASA